MKNLKPFIVRLGEFLEAVPSSKNDNINWEELLERKEVAKLSLDALSHILGGITGNESSTKKSKCNPAKPKADENPDDPRGGNTCPGTKPDN